MNYPESYTNLACWQQRRVDLEVDRRLKGTAEYESLANKLKEAEDNGWMKIEEEMDRAIFDMKWKMMHKVLADKNAMRVITSMWQPPWDV